MAEKLLELPIGTQDFEKLRRGNKLYVDKLDFKRKFSIGNSLILEQLSKSATVVRSGKTVAYGVRISLYKPFYENCSNTILQ